MSQLPNQQHPPQPYRNPRTNPFGKYITGFFNFRTELLPLARGPNPSISAHLAILGFWGGLLIGGKYVLDTYNEQFRFETERHYKEHQADVTGAHHRLPYYTADTPQHLIPIKPYQDHFAVRPDVVFGNNKVWAAAPETFASVNTTLRARESQVDSLMMQSGASWNIHRYTKAKPASDYDAIRLKALYNLATATYHENRAPGYFLPISAQLKIAEIQKETLV